MKTKPVLFLAITCFFFHVFSYSQNANPQSLIPSKLARYKFGMGVDSFKLINKTALFSQASAFDFRIECTDTKISSEFKNVTFYFDAENNKPLYEMIVEYKDENKMKAFIQSKLKAPNDDGDKWKWTTNEGYIFKAWTFGKKLVFALVLPNTEWDETNH